MADKLRWGMIGCGRIANSLAGGIALSEGSQLVAAAARDLDRAEAFAEKHGATRAYGSYEELVNDEDIDAVCVATVHATHASSTLLALRAGKHVLCEKPFAMNATEAAAMIDEARRTKRFLMEAMWTRFLPNIVRLRELIAEGAIGEVRMVHADFGYRTPWNPTGRTLDPAAGGGALLDAGVYPLSLASMLLGKPLELTGVAYLGETGVDEQFAATLRYDAGRLAVASGAVRTNTHKQAWIVGTDGQILLEPGWWGGSKLTLFRPYHKEELEFPYAANRYVYEVDEVVRCVAAGKPESEIMPLDETLELLRTMDALRDQWGLKYPGE